MQNLPQLDVTNFAFDLCRELDQRVMRIPWDAPQVIGCIATSATHPNEFSTRVCQRSKRILHVLSFLWLSLSHNSFPGKGSWVTARIGKSLLRTWTFTARWDTTPIRIELKDICTVAMTFYLMKELAVLGDFRRSRCASHQYLQAVPEKPTDLTGRPLWSFSLSVLQTLHKTR